VHDHFVGAGAFVLLAAWPGGACGHQIRTMLVSTAHSSRPRSGAAHLVHGGPPGRCHPGRAIVTMIVVARASGAHPAGVKDPGTLSAVGPDLCQRAPPVPLQRGLVDPPSAPGTPSTSPPPRPAGENRINVETFGYTESLVDNSPHKFPRSPNPPHYPALAEHRHPLSHQTAR
jgi:hypothetical protein